MGRLSPLLGGLMGSGFGDFVGGFVWIEGERVLGNVTLQRVDFGGTRSARQQRGSRARYRGRGMARALMLSSLSEIAHQGGGWAILRSGWTIRRQSGCTYRWDSPRYVKRASGSWYRCPTDYRFARQTCRFNRAAAGLAQPL